MSEHNYEVFVAVERDGEDIEINDVPEEARPQVAASLLRCAAQFSGGYHMLAAGLVAMAETDAQRRWHEAQQRIQEQEKKPRLLLPDTPTS